MSLAPNETQKEYNRKTELMKLQNTRALTLQELYELRDLCKNSTSHLKFTTVGSI